MRLKSGLRLLTVTLLSRPLVSIAQGWPEDYGGVMLQAFYWDSYSDTKWTNLQSGAEELGRYFDLVWLPQSARAGSSPSMGYDDKYWFPVGTNYTGSFGTEKELRELISALKAVGTLAVADVVINHRANVSNWVDFPEETFDGVTYQLVSTDIVSDDDGGATKTWAAQNGYSLSGNKDSGEGWSGMRDLDHYSTNVQTNVKAYLKMLLEDLGYAGFRYDMTKGYAGSFTALYNSYASPTYSVGEYWDGNQSSVQTWLESTRSDGQIMSAAFDFPLRYTVRDAVNNSSWSAFGRSVANSGGLCKSDSYKRYAVTFVENHDTEYRGSSEQQDPIKKDTLAANAFILAMPGTPCVFLKHWQAYKNEIGQMIKIRKAVGVTNESDFTELVSDPAYYAMKTEGCGDRSLICLLGDTRAGENAISACLDGYSLVVKGYHYAFYTKGVNDIPPTYTVSAPSGTYDNSLSVTITPSNGTAVYTTDGTEPTTTNGTRISAAVTLTFLTTTTLKVGVISGDSVSDISTYTYTIAAFSPYDITVYVNVDEVGWSAVNFWAWDTDDTSTNYTGGTWPGERAPSTVVNGKTWYYMIFTVTASDATISFVFSTGSGTPQTVDVTGVNTTSYFEVTSTATTAEAKKCYEVNDVTAADISLPRVTLRDGAVYDMSGRSAERKSPSSLPPGVYISGGGKVIIKD